MVPYVTQEDVSDYGRSSILFLRHIVGADSALAVLQGMINAPWLNSAERFVAWALYLPGTLFLWAVLLTYILAIVMLAYVRARYGRMHAGLV